MTSLFAKVNKFNGETDSPLDQDIAIIGLAGRVGNSENMNEFHDLIMNGESSIIDLPFNRKKDSQTLYQALYPEFEKSDLNSFARGGYLSQIDEFDYAYFGIPYLEAQSMDPLQKILLETAVLALADADYDSDDLKASDTSVFVGQSRTSEESYKQYVRAIDSSLENVSMAGNLQSVLASRISYQFDLKGGSYVIDTACSSGLVALIKACQELNNGLSDLAIVTAGNILLLPPVKQDSDLGILSGDGETRSFDYQRSGTGFGEGAVALILKPLAEAQADGDRIYAKIIGSAINQDGSSAGITAPNAAQQKNLYQAAWEDSEIDPRDLQYIEAHGTATQLGDLVEFESLVEAFSDYTTDRQFCALSSAKSQVGHTDAASGLVGVIKAIFALNSDYIPAARNFIRPNPELDFIESPLYINTSPRPWQANQEKICMVNSFGMSGTNACVILTEAGEQLTVRENQIKFKSTRCWLESPDKEALNDLIAEQVIETAEGEIYQLNVSTEKQWEIGEHLVEDSYMLVGTAYLEIILQIAENKYPGQSIEFCDVILNQALVLDKRQEAKLLVELETQDVPGRKFKISSKIDGVWSQHCTGEFRLVERKNKNMKKLLDQVTDDPQSEILLPNSMLYGFVKTSQRWQVSQNIILNEDYLINSYSLANVFLEEKNQYNVYPSILDACLNFSNTIIGNGIYLPWQYSKLTVYSKSPSKGYSIVKKTETENSEVLNLSLFLVDQDGELWAESESYIVKKFRGIIPEADKYKYSERKWIPYLNGQIEEFDSRKKLDLLWLTLDSEIAESEDYSGYRSVVLELSSEEKLDSASFYEKSFGLTKDLLGLKNREFKEFYFVGRRGYPVLASERSQAPEQASLAGMAKSLQLEYPSIKIIYIDLDENADRYILPDLAQLDSLTFSLAKRGSVYYREVIEKVKLEDRKELKNLAGGVYLITGGLGGMGLSIASALAEEGAEALILTGRRTLEDSDLSKMPYTNDQSVEDILLTIEETGSKIKYLACDVSDPDCLETGLVQVEEEFGKITGIVHCAGLAGQGFFANNSLEDLLITLEAKVQGTNNLVDYFKFREKLDFFVVCSSSTSLFGSIGQADYAVANEYLNLLASKEESQNIVSLLWPSWLESGMAYRYRGDVQSVDDDIFRPLTNKEGANYFINAISQKDLTGSTSLIISDLNRKQVQTEKRLLAYFTRELSSADKTEINIKEQNVETGSKSLNKRHIKAELHKIWIKILGRDDFTYEDKFFELNRDSILATYMLSEINKLYGDILDITDLFTYSSINSQAEKIYDYYKEVEVEKNTTESDLEKMLQDLYDGQISTDELKGKI